MGEVALQQETSRNGATLRTQELVKRYGRRTVVSGVNLALSTGEIIALLGPNGAGKTTTFYMIVGFVRPNRGRIFLRGEDITRLPMHRRARKGVGYLAQEPSAFRKLSVRDNIMAILEFHEPSRERREAKLEELLEEFNLAHLEHSMAYTLSGGERRRLEIARAICTNPDFLLLDEPFTGVDPKSILEIQEIVGQLKRKGLGILITDHSVRETLRIADRVYLMYDGKLEFTGSPHEFISSDIVRRLYTGEGYQL
ncbi:MAG: LPS export ABC transporter ATP-binding protein [Deinococcus sp.]|nr:LPS export ABC transporter ATP-binding protein [Deinococcus sp.]